MLMRTTLSMNLSLGLIIALTISSLGQTRQANLKPGSVEAKALTFFEQIKDKSFDDYLRRVRLPKVTPAFQAEVIAQLANTDAVKASERMKAKLTAVIPVLKYHERYTVVTTKIINSEHAFVGFQARAVLLISEKAINLLSAEELMAMVAHELGHEYFWGEFMEARQRKQNETMQELELRCDSISVITLLRLGVDPANMVSGLSKMNDFNVRTVNLDNRPYPSLKERFKFIQAMTEMVRMKNSAETITAYR